MLGHDRIGWVEIVINGESGPNADEHTQTEWGVKVFIGNNF